MSDMKIYGRTKANKSQLNELCETVVSAEPSALRELASFLYRCADSIEDMGDEWEYENFESSEFVSPEFVVFNPDVVSD